jgi:hypothetical protein
MPVTNCFRSAPSTKLNYQQKSYSYKETTILKKENHVESFLFPAKEKSYWEKIRIYLWRNNRETEGQLLRKSKIQAPYIYFLKAYILTKKCVRLSFQTIV